ncbi:hypothetical protein [Rubrivirga sp. IMCC45206]|uniref:hypothetical protein n=1 Tax=Rubrivirga sp. IMCC45206 TaxID=3391614 RepID=UPI00398FB39C
MSNPVTRFLFDPVDAEGDRVPARFRFTGDQRWWAAPLGVGLLLLVAGMVVGLVSGDVSRTLFSYLIGWVFCVSIAIGALFFVMIQHITKSRWSVTLRRIPEALAASFPLLALAGIPVLLGYYDLFHWTHSELFDPASPEYDAIIAGKEAYLNMPFFVIRYVVYFALFSVLGHKLYTLSVRNDAKPDVQNTLDLRKWSAIGIPLAAVATAFFAYDYLMSTDPHWFSTMFGVYFFAGGWLGALCLIAFLALLLKKGGMATDITVEHTQDVGKFMFGFVVFWTYVAFSQYMLYWYANLPEEIVWFQKRFTGGWEVVAWSLFIFHFILPFLILLPRNTKRIAPALATMAVWLLVMHWVDLWWIAMPSMHVAAEAGHAALASGGGELLASLQTIPPAEAVGEATSGMALHVVEPHLPIVEMAVWLGLFGLFLGTTMLRLGRHAVTPYGDPYYADSLRFENV